MSNEEKIAAIIRDWTLAIENRDREGILAKHDDDLVMIDFPNTVTSPSLIATFIANVTHEHHSMPTGNETLIGPEVRT